MFGLAVPAVTWLINISNQVHNEVGIRLGYGTVYFSSVENAIANYSDFIALSIYTFSGWFRVQITEPALLNMSTELFII